jgi:hypothetical protein
MNKNDFHFAIVSRRRPDNVPKMIEITGVNTIYWYVSRGDLDDYKNAGARLVRVTGGLVESRNAAIEDAYLTGRTCVMLDDDLKKIEMITGAGKTEITFANMIDEMKNVLDSSGLYLAGISPTNNTFYFDPKKPLSLKHFIIASCIMIKPSEPKLLFDPQFKTKEDYDYTLQHIKTFGGVVRLNYIMPTFGHYTNKGGVVDYRTTELEQQSIRKLKKKWGSIIADNPRRPNEVLIKIK